MAGRNGLPDGEGPRHRSAANAETHAHTHSHTFYACRHILSLARSLAQQAGRRRQGEQAAGRERRTAGGPGEWAMIIMTLATMSCGGCDGGRCGCDLKRLLECKTSLTFKFETDTYSCVPLNSMSVEYKC